MKVLLDIEEKTRALISLKLWDRIIKALYIRQSNQINQV